MERKQTNTESKYEQPKILTLSKRLLKALHKEYNSLYFDNKLRKCNMSFFYDNGEGNIFGWFRGVGSNRKNKPSTISINRNNYWTAESLKIILVHEMVHQYVFECMGGVIFRSHGKKFKKVCKMLYDKYGLVIPQYIPDEHIIREYPIPFDK